MKLFKQNILSPYRYFFYLFKVYSNLRFNVFSYSVYLISLFLASTGATLLLDKCVQSPNIVNLLVLCFLLSSIAVILRHFTFSMSNTFLKGLMWKISIRDILLAVSNFHPLWLTSSSVSGGTLRENMIDVGLGGFAKIMNRLSYFIPMVFELITSFWRVGALNISLVLSFVLMLGSFEILILHPQQNSLSRQRADIVKGKRRRFLQVEKLEYSRLQKYRTRSKEEYKGVVNRLVEYRSYFEDCTSNVDFRIALVSSVSDVTKELIGFGLIFWIIYQNDEMISFWNNSPPIITSTHITSTMVVLMVISMRNIVKQFSQVIEHKSYADNELSEFQPLSSLLQTSFSSEEISSNSGVKMIENEETVDKHREKLCDYFRNKPSLNKYCIDLEYAYATSLPSNGVHFVMVPNKISLVGGEMIFVRGLNGTGKVIFFFLFYFIYQLFLI